MKATIVRSLEGRETWKVDDVFSNGAPFKFVNPALPGYSVQRYLGRWVISINGRDIRGRLGRLRLFASVVSAAIAAEQHHAERIAIVREINEANRAFESMDFPSHDRGTV